MNDDKLMKDTLDRFPILGELYGLASDGLRDEIAEAMSEIAFQTSERRRAMGLLIEGAALVNIWQRRAHNAERLIDSVSASVPLRFLKEIRLNQSQRDALL